VAGPSRRRGTKNGSRRELRTDKVPDVVARSRSGDTRSVVLPCTSTADALTGVFRAILRPDVTLCTDGSVARRPAAQALGVSHFRLVSARNERSRGIYHVQTVNSYQGRLRGWMGRFRGVATKYLDRYLTWHVIHKQVQHLSATRTRAVLVGNAAEMRPERCCPERGAMLSAA